MNDAGGRFRSPAAHVTSPPVGVRQLLVLTVALSAPAVPARAASAASAARAASAASGGDSVFGGVTSRVTVNKTGGESSSVFVSTRPAVSRDGRFVAFSAGARDLAPGGDPRFGGIYVRDRLAGRTFVASVAENGAFPSTAATSQPCHLGERALRRIRQLRAQPRSW